MNRKPVLPRSPAGPRSTRCSTPLTSWSRFSTFDRSSGAESRRMRSAWFLRLVKVGYAVAGWIVVSGLVLTASGFVRRQIER